MECLDVLSLATVQATMVISYTDVHIQAIMNMPSTKTQLHRMTSSADLANFREIKGEFRL